MISLTNKRRSAKIEHFCNLVGFFIFFVSLIIHAACLSDEKYYPFQGKLREFAHQNGLIVELPDNLVATANDQGFLIEPADVSNIRMRNSLMVWIARRENVAIDGRAYLRQETVGNRTLNYQIERREGGSGGDEYYFTAWEKIDRNFIVYNQQQQSEYGEPNFATCWQIIEKTAIKK